MDFLSQIKEFENVFNQEELELIDNMSCRPKWEMAISGSSPKRPFWRMNLMNDELFTQTLFQKVLQTTQLNATLNDVYFNATTTSMSSSVHVDAHDEDVNVFLVYMNKEWNIEWGGQTVFINRHYSKQQDGLVGNNATKIFYPRYNSALLFKGYIAHFAEAPTRYFEGFRITLAYRFKVL